MKCLLLLPFVSWFVVSISSVAFAAAISSSPTHTLAIKTDGTLWAWGSAPLGDATFVARIAPVQIGTDRDWFSVAAGNGKSLAIKTDGTLWEWYGDSFNASARVLVPRQIGVDSDWRVIAIGAYGTSAAIKTDGSLWLWGNYSGSSFPNAVLPTRAATSNDFEKVTVADARVYAIRSNGSIWGMGSDEQGLGISGPMDQRDGYLFRLNADTDWRDVITRSGGQTFALKSGGSLWAWGQNAVGQLGIGTYTNQRTPARVGTDSDWAQVGNQVALKTDGSLWIWQRDQASSVNKPTRFGGATNWVAVGDEWALDADERVWHVGNGFGATSGTTDPGIYAIPTLFDLSADWRQVVATEYFDVGVRRDGTLWTWGNASFYFGNLLPSSLRPQRFGDSVGWSKLSAGRRHVLAIKSDGSLWGWGDNSYLQLGIRTSYTAPATVAMPTRIGTSNDWRVIFAAAESSAAIKADGTLWFWGTCGYCARSSDPSNPNAPAQFGGQASWADVATRGYDTLARKADGSIYLIDSTGLAQIGVGSTWRFIGLTQDGRYIAQKTDGSVWSWGGDNRYSVLGDMTTINRAQPTQISDFQPNLVKVAGSINGSSMVTVDGKRRTWTAFPSFHSALMLAGGVGTISYQIAKPTVVQNDRTWIDVAAYGARSYGIDAVGRLYAWDRQGNYSYTAPDLLRTVAASSFTRTSKSARISGARLETASILDFGKLGIGVAGEPIELDLANSSLVPIAIHRIHVEAPFVLSHDCPTTLAVSGSCKINVRFTPAHASIELSRLQVDSDAQISHNGIEVRAEGADIDPHPFEGEAISSAEPASWQYVRNIVVSGLSGTASARVSGDAQLATGCTATPTQWRSVAGVANGSTVCVRVRASPVPATTVSATITIGARSAEYLVTTRDRSQGTLVVSGGLLGSSFGTLSVCTSLSSGQGRCWATPNAYACEVQFGASATIHNAGAKAFRIDNLASDLTRNVERWPTGVGACKLDIDGDGFLDAKTDGIGWVKYLLGYSTTVPLIDPNPVCSTNTTAQSQSSALNDTLIALGYSHGEQRATQLGVVLLRAMLGVTGSAATVGTDISWDDFIANVNTKCGTPF